MTVKRKFVAEMVGAMLLLAAVAHNAEIATNRLLIFMN